MRVKALAFTLLLSFVTELSADTKQKGLDTEPVDWLLEQIALGEAQRKSQLVLDSLAKLDQIEPNNTLAKAAWIRFYFAQQEHEKAQQLLKEFKAQYPNHREIRRLSDIAFLVTPEGKSKLQSIRLLARAGRTEQARNEFNQLFPKGAPTTELTFEYANIIAANENFWHEANRIYNSLIATYPNTVEFEIAKAKHILNKRPSDKNALATIRKYATFSNYRTQVEGIWLSALSDMPVNSATKRQYDYYFGLFPNSQEGRNQYKDFSALLRARIKLESNPYYRAWQRGKKQMEKGALPTAESLFRRALVGRPNDADILGDLGRVLMRQGHHDKAKPYLAKAVTHATAEDKPVWQALLTTAQFWHLIDLASQAIDELSLQSAEKYLTQALKLNEDANTVMLYSARIAIAKGDFELARKRLERVIQQDPENGYALSLLLNILAQQERIDVINNFAADLSPQQRALIEQGLVETKVRIFRNRADELSSRGEPQRAISVLQEAIKLSPKSGWLYYDLADLYLKVGDEASAKSTYNQVLWRYPLNADIRYTHALFLRRIDNYEAALTSLSYVPLKHRTNDIIELEASLRLGRKFAQFDTLLNTDDQQQARIVLTELSEQPSLTPTQEAKLAAAWFNVGEQEKGRQALSKVLSDNPTMDFYWHVLYSNWLLDAPEDEHFHTWFSNLHLIPVQTSQQKQDVEALSVQYQIKLNPENEHAILANYVADYPSSIPAIARLITFELTQSNVINAYALYQQAHEFGELDFETELEIATHAFKHNRSQIGQTVTTHLVYKVAQDETYNQRRLMALLLDFDDEPSVMALTKELLSLSPRDPELLNLAGQVAERFDYQEEALAYYRQVLQHSSEDASKAPIFALSEDQATDTWYMRSARSGIAKIKNRTDGHVAIAGDFSGQTSTQNDSELGLGAALFEAYFPFYQGHGFLKADFVTVSAQQTNFDQSFSASRYGTGALCFDTCPLISITPRDQGVALGVGWQNENWRVDFGSTPQDFLLSNYVGGVLYQNSWGNFSYDIELERRALTNSVLSYAGLEDINSNDYWGAVTSNGITLGLYHDLGLDWGFWATLDYQKYLGKNVLDNDRKRAMTGAYYRLLQERNYELSVGANLLYWGYKHNLSEETFGHGGYYSPQKYLGASIPVTFDGRVGDDFVYRFKVSGGYSESETEAIAFYPNNPELQTLAELKSLETGITPIFSASESAGLSWGIEGLVEYRLAKHWLLGASFDIKRADFYEPNFGQIYLKYLFNPSFGQLPLVPRPIVPYANY